jgi:hypothetical protein
MHAVPSTGVISADIILTHTERRRTLDLTPHTIQEAQCNWSLVFYAVSVQLHAYAGIKGLDQRDAKELN